MVTRGVSVTCPCTCTEICSSFGTGFRLLGDVLGVAWHSINIHEHRLGFKYVSSIDLASFLCLSPLSSEVRLHGCMCVAMS